MVKRGSVERHRGWIPLHSPDVDEGRPGKGLVSIRVKGGRTRGNGKLMENEKKRRSIPFPCGTTLHGPVRPSVGLGDDSPSLRGVYPDFVFGGC